LTLQRREEHGNTFAPEIELSTGFDGIPLKGEEIIGRYGRKKTSATGFIQHPVVKSHWRRIGQPTPNRTPSCSNEWLRREGGRPKVKCRHTLPISNEPLAAKLFHVSLKL
jgi:hypothetical protein